MSHQTIAVLICFLGLVALSLWGYAIKRRIIHAVREDDSDAPLKSLLWFNYFTARAFYRRYSPPEKLWRAYWVVEIAVNACLGLILFLQLFRVR